MKLADLQPALLSYVVGPDGVSWRRVEDLAAAQGLKFLCPACYAANGGPKGTHSVICWSRSRGVPDDAAPGPGRWVLAGSSLEDLSLWAEPGQTRSIQLNGGCNWHGYITDGRAHE